MEFDSYQPKESEQMEFEGKGKPISRVKKEQGSRKQIEENWKGMKGEEESVRDDQSPDTFWIRD